MDSSIIAAAIAASATIGVALLKFGKPKSNGVRHTTKTGVSSNLRVRDVSNSVVAVGTNISQSFSETVHNHYSEPLGKAEPFHERVESKPTLIETINDLSAERKPYEMTQVPKNYKGITISWYLVFSGIWPIGDGHGPWMLGLRSTQEQYTFCTVLVPVDIEKYPKLKVIDRGHRVWVEGRIISVSSNVIGLENGAQIAIE